MKQPVKFTGTEKQKTELKKDFLEFSGGSHPGEAFDEVEKYLEHNVTDENRESVEEFFESWAEEEEARQAVIDSKARDKKTIKLRASLPTNSKSAATFIAKTIDKRLKKISELDPTLGWVVTDVNSKDRKYDGFTLTVNGTDYRISVSKV